ncbi:MAG TPA: hypothetical protein VJ570_12465, partial [Holophagaceae bacterium]|nr:hypothetical protein [Holophagaceae bacterium]
MGTHGLTALCLLLAAAPASAGGLQPLSKTAQAAVRQGHPARVEQAKRRLLDGRAELGLGELDDLRLRRVHTDAYGQTHARFQQLHRGLP